MVSKNERLGKFYLEHVPGVAVKTLREIRSRARKRGCSRPELCRINRCRECDADMLVIEIFRLRMQRNNLRKKVSEQEWLLGKSEEHEYRRFYLEDFLTWLKKGSYLIIDTGGSKGQEDRYHQMINEYEEKEDGDSQ